ncbi:hypothetical protein G6F40_017422 [Rhizopus arrhizus]|nr:hypothetical protein G6F40_017422 [Rhizopus arrhizus]
MARAWVAHRSQSRFGVIGQRGAQCSTGGTADRTAGQRRQHPQGHPCAGGRQRCRRLGGNTAAAAVLGLRCHRPARRRRHRCVGARCGPVAVRLPPR